MQGGGTDVGDRKVNDQHQQHKGPQLSVPAFVFGFTMEEHSLPASSLHSVTMSALFSA